MLSGKAITSGITGCSPAIKSLDLIRELKHLGAAVHVIMTPNLVNFVTPLLVQREAGTTIQIEQFELPKTYDSNHQANSVKSDRKINIKKASSKNGEAFSFTENRKSNSKSASKRVSFKMKGLRIVLFYIN